MSKLTGTKSYSLHYTRDFAFVNWYTVGTNSVPIVNNSQTTEITIGLPIVTCLHRVRRIPP